MRYLRGAALFLLCTACAPRTPHVPAAPEPSLASVTITTDTVTGVVPLRPPRERAVLAVDPLPEPERAPLAVALGEATYYADYFDGRRTASGVVFRNSEPYAAHRTYPFGTVVRVTNTRNERSVVVRVVDRGPNGTSARAQRTIIDLSRSAAEALDFVRAGRVPVRVEVLEWGQR